MEYQRVGGRMRSKVLAGSLFSLGVVAIVGFIAIQSSQS